MILFLPLLSLLSLLSLPSGSSSATCAGCPADAEVNQEIVDFALQELEGGEGGLCKKTVISVDNFQQQVVAGYVYKFDLVLEHSLDNLDSCEESPTNPESCHVEVYEIPWQNVKTVSWDKVTCTGNPFN
eukprot:GFUD01013830.1.p1 GENE.GFUD01013830.1~~GFUD01013830.1.p1  ORF type:complete len:129 (+),score=46.93 GFUD01013830.1:122-508(+)